MPPGNKYSIIDLNKFKNAIGFYRTCRILIFSLLVVLIAATAPLAEQKFHGHEAGPKLNYDSLWNAAVPLAESKTGNIVLKNLLAKYGGEEHLKKLKSARFTWEMSGGMIGDTLDIIKSVRFDRSYKVERELSNGIGVRGFRGDKGWFQTPDTSIDLTNTSRLKAELFSYFVLGLPLVAVSDEFPEVRYGQRTNEPYHYIYLMKPDTMMMVIATDPVDYLIYSVEGVIYEDSSSYVFINNFEHHKQFDGYFFPTSLTNISMGLIVGRSTLQKVELNVDFDESYFSPRPTDL